MLMLLALLGLFRRKVIMMLLLGVAIAGPYAFYERSWYERAQQKFTSLFHRSAAPLSALEPIDMGAVDGSLPEGVTQVALPPKLEGRPVEDLREVFRLDVTAEWVLSRWSRVSTVLADVQLEGLRVPLVTGTKAHDLAGSLTYYFDKSGKVQRLEFQGVTGDYRRLADLAQSAYHLQPVQTLAAALYVSSWNGQLKSALRVAHAPVVQANQPHARYDVWMEINWPADYYTLSTKFQQQLESERQALRW